MFTKLDPTDWQLIHLLQQNARASYVTLARQLGLARTSVVTRLARLERDGIIQCLGSELEQATVRAYGAISALPRSIAGVIRVLERWSKSRNSPRPVASSTTWPSCAASPTKSSESHSSESVISRR